MQIWTAIFTIALIVGIVALMTVTLPKTTTYAGEATVSLHSQPNIDSEGGREQFLAMLLSANGAKEEQIQDKLAVISQLRASTGTTLLLQLGSTS